MKKTTNVKATKLMTGDHVKIAGKLHRISTLNLAFGRKRKAANRVRIHLHNIDEQTYMTLDVPTTTRFTIFTKK